MNFYPNPARLIIMKKATFFLFGLSFFLLISCKKDDIKQTTTRIKTLDINRSEDSASLSFEYHDNLIKKITIIENGLIWYIEYSYNSSDKIVSVEENYGSTEDGIYNKSYTYQSDKIIETETSGSDKIDSTVYLLNSSGYVEELKHYKYLSVNGSEDYIIAGCFTFQWLNNNCTKITFKFYDSNGVLVNDWTKYTDMTYDNHINPLCFIPGIPIILNEFFDYEVIPFSKNNVLSQSTSKNISVTHQYEYNDKGHPLSAIINVTENDSSEIETATLNFEY